MTSFIDSEDLKAAVYSARQPRSIHNGQYCYISISDIPGADELPVALLILLENVIRRSQSDEEAYRAAQAILQAGLTGSQGAEIAFMPSRVLFQDFTGVPVFVDFAAMRDEVALQGQDPAIVNPRIPCTLVIDHSVVADEAGSACACDVNQKLEAERNRERFAFLKWASKSFENVEIIPPGSGICHQLNIENFGRVVMHDALAQTKVPTLCFDTLVGTDSHTTTANGIGVLGWGVGGIEAEAAALGQAISMLVPRVVELRLEGRLQDGVTGMDVALHVAELLRTHGVVGSIVEVRGSGVSALTPTQRACIANMTPEYGCTATLFPVDEAVIEYLEMTARPSDEVALVQTYMEHQGLFGVDTKKRRYAQSLTLDLSRVEPSLAGPSRPHDRLLMSQLKDRVEASCKEHKRDLSSGPYKLDALDDDYEIDHGALAIAAITSCTTATDPAMMLRAGLVAKRACELGLSPKPWVKKILAPGSHVGQYLLERAGLMKSLEDLGFYICGYGCMSCIGNSGDILPSLMPYASQIELCSVLSGNRNFEGRISPDVSQNYLCDPGLVVAYSIAGTMRVDLTSEPVGISSANEPVYVCDLLPSDEEVEHILRTHLSRELYAESSQNLFVGSAEWQSIEVDSSATFAWDDSSTYVRRPPYFDMAQATTSFEVSNARALVYLGDFVTTDHISPAGKIASQSPAARYLEEHNIDEDNFNSYGSRRGNHEVMVRGTFANVKLENFLAEGRRGCWTRNLVTGEIEPIYDAAMKYREDAVPLIVLAGKLYGSGSSRDWAGKGPALLGIRAVIAESFERIHRSNLVGMGILPLEFVEGASAASLGLDGTESFSIDPIDLSAGLPSQAETCVHAQRADGTTVQFMCRVRIDTPAEGHYIAKGGILPFVLESLVH